MEIPEHIQRVEAALRSTRSLFDDGITPRQLRDLVQGGQAVRVARGWFVGADVWKGWYPEDRHLAQVVAAHHNASAPPLFTHFSAAVLQRLPVWNLGSGRVHTATARGTSSNQRVQRHHLDIPDTQQESIASYRCTDPQRTLFDLAACSGMETLLGCADRALRRVASRKRSVNQDARQRWLGEMADLIDRAPPGRRGIRRLRRAVALADPRAESVLESVSRLQLLRLGYDVELQVPVHAPTGGFYYMDFELLGYEAFGECDGEAKYSDPGMLNGQAPADRVIAEKKRDNWAMTTTGKKMVHWGARDVRTPEQLARTLREFHIPLPRGGRHASK